ncbi:MAG: N-acetylmuramoyl-L-alanine amidase [Clostridia bacterium]|nr:N-acetylmuramoyl-L-alanine amidase [Clostridia bacterium]
MMADVEKKQIAYNRLVRTSAIKYIVIHDTGNKSKGSDADAHFKYFNGGNRNSSADFFVDDTKILQVNDYTKYYTWQVGDGKGKYGITNQNSVGIEICVNADGDYSKAFENAVELTKHLMKELDIPAERVVRHYDASRKNCPASMSGEDWARWKEFKEKIMECDSKFIDTKGHFSENAINELCQMGIVNGRTENRFMPNEPITRGEVAAIARRIIRYIMGK